MENNIAKTGDHRLYWKTAILLTALVGLYTVLVFFTPSSVLLSLALCALLGVVLASVGFNVMHDGAHGSYSRNQWVNEMMGHSLNLLGGSVYFWKLKHNVNHHTFTNVEGMDDDIDIKPWVRVHEGQPKHWFHRFQHIYSLLPRLKERHTQVAGTLSGGEQQMLAIGRALMGRPKLLLLDEPSMGLAPLMVEKVFEVVRAVAAEGMTILLVEQNAKLALEVCSRGYVMESGLITLADTSAALLADSRVRAAYLGE